MALALMLAYPHSTVIVATYGAQPTERRKQGCVSATTPPDEDQKENRKR